MVLVIALVTLLVIAQMPETPLPHEPHGRAGPCFALRKGQSTF